MMKYNNEIQKQNLYPTSQIPSVDLSKLLNAGTDILQ